MSEHRYHLQRYTSNNTSRFECPQCHDKHSLALYVDDATGEPINEACGRCNHESGCGYHLTPSQFFALNPEARQALHPNSLRRTPTPPKPLCTLDRDLVGRSFDRDLNSTLSKWLQRYFSIDQILESTLKYMLGTTRDGRTIYWQVDKDDRVRAGKIIAYGDDGHRIKNGDPRLNGRPDVDWAHARLKRDGRLPNDWELTQCLFGEHLLNRYPDLPVAVVESEKSAIVCSLAYPSFLWLACGGIGQLSEAKALPLRGRTVTLFPDRDGVDKWKVVGQTLSKFCRVRVSSILSNDDDPAHSHWDLADIIIDGMDHPESEAEATFRKMTARNPALLYLRDKLDCIIVNK